MFIELIDLLRCPHPHEGSWLVLAADEVIDRHVVRGTLGCPICGAEFPIAAGEADLRGERRPGSRAVPKVDPLAPDDSDAATMRLAALLGLGDGEGRVALTGAHAPLAAELERLASVAVLAVNGPPDRPWHVSAIRCDGALPLAPASLRGLAIGAGSDPIDLAASLPALRPRARVVAPADHPRPADLHELARDDREWVAELRETVSGFVPLTVRRSPDDDRR